MSVFPFSAIVGQREMKLALMVAAVDARIGGVMIFGDRGTGKSTAARALAGTLPPIRAVEGCRYNCEPENAGECPDSCSSKRVRKIAVPFVDLPLGSTEDRVLGTLDLEKALAAGEKHFEPGLLAKAHRGFLYIDEINLLEDHVVDLLLDVAASGENLVERDGLSVRHKARFVLIGSGNPEEGELRPQLLDRFGLSVEVRTPDVSTTGSRSCAAAMRRNVMRSNSPPNGRAKMRRFCAQIELAKKALPKVKTSARMLRSDGDVVPDGRRRRPARRTDPDARRAGAGRSGGRDFGDGRPPENHRTAGAATPPAP